MLCIAIRKAIKSFYFGINSVRVLRKPEMPLPLWLGWIGVESLDFAYFGQSWWHIFLFLKSLKALYLLRFGKVYKRSKEKLESKPNCCNQLVLSLLWGRLQQKVMTVWQESTQAKKHMTIWGCYYDSNLPSYWDPSYVTYIQAITLSFNHHFHKLNIHCQEPL